MPTPSQVVSRRSSREPGEVYLSGMLPRKEKYHRCAAIVTELATGGCLRDLAARRALHVPTQAALSAAAAAISLSVEPLDFASLPDQQLAALLVHLEAHVPLLPLPVAAVASPSLATDGPKCSSIRTACDQTSSRDAVQGCGTPDDGTQQQPAPRQGSHSCSTLSLVGMRQPHMQLLRVLLLHIARGMHHLHSVGVVHGELRLDNVVLTGQLPSMTELLRACSGTQLTGFTAKLKDVGLCSLGWSSRQVCCR